jgi:aspartate-semialdehyde dehydrogenase
MRIAVIGATGAVGRECLTLLDKASLPMENLVAVASPRSAGLDLRTELGLSLPLAPVTTLAAFDPTTVDVALLCAGADVSREMAAGLVAAGVLVVDNSSAFRLRPDVPLVVPQVNPQELERRPAGGIISNPNCSTIQLVRALAPLEALAGLDDIVVATYQAASGGGLRGLAELAEESARILADPALPDPAFVDPAFVDPVLAGPASPREKPGRFGRPLSFDLIPGIGAADGSGFTHEERKLVAEPRKILGLPGLRLSATAVRVPVFHCHSEAVHVRTRRPLTTASAEEALAAEPGIKVYRGSDTALGYPTPRSVGRRDQDRAMVHVGRIRVDPDDARALWMWIVADNLWVGAALNAVQIVELAVRYQWLGRPKVSR